MGKIIFFMVMVSSLLFSTTGLSSGNGKYDSVNKRHWKYYKINASKGDKVSIAVSHMSADVDLYVKVGSKPTRRTKDASSTRGGKKTDRCSVNLHSNGTVYIGVYGYRAGNFTVTATKKTNGIPKLESGIFKNGSVERRAWQYYTIEASKYEEVSTIIDRISAKAYLYAKVGSFPTSRSYDCKAKYSGRPCKISQLNKKDTVYIGVYGKRDSSFRIKSTKTKKEPPVQLTSKRVVSDTVERRKIKYYKIDLAKNEKLTSVITSANSRKYVYVKIGSLPTTSSFDTRTTKIGTSCHIVNSSSTTVTAYIGVYGRYEGDFNIKVTTTHPTVLSPNIVVTDNAERREFKYYKISGSKNDTIKITLNNCSSKKYLYAKIGELPTGKKVHDDCRIRGSRATKECSLTLSKSSTVYIAVDGRNGGSFDIKASDGTTQNAKVSLINTLINSIAKDNNKWGGQCKTYLQKKFNSVAESFKGLNNEKLIMPQNSDASTAKSWKNNGGYAFDKVASYNAGKYKNTNATNIKNLLKQAKKGDFVQMYWNPHSRKKSLTLHTILLLEDVSENKNINWADSNLNGDEKVHTGTFYPWGSTKTFQSLVNYLSNDYCTNTCGVTLYRLTDRIQKK